MPNLNTNNKCVVAVATAVLCTILGLPGGDGLAAASASNNNNHHQHNSHKEVVTNQFHVIIKRSPKSEVDDNPREIADQVAKEHGFHNLGHVLGNAEEFHFVHHALPAARIKRSTHHIRTLKADKRVHSAVQQTGFRRVKRGYKPLEQQVRVPTQDEELFGDRLEAKRSPWVSLRRALDDEEQQQADQTDPRVVHDENFFNRLQLSHHRNDKRGYNPLKVENLVDLPPETDPTDPLFQHQWYLKNNGEGKGKKDLDLNVEPAWALGYTGKNVTTAIMDDGVDYIHEDPKYNYNAKASYDLSTTDPSPYPR